MISTRARRTTPAALNTQASTPWRRLLPEYRLLAIVKTPLLIAVGGYLAGGTSNERALGWSMLLGAALWATLYALNEATDAVFEAGDPDQSELRRWLITVAVLLVGAAGFVSAPLLALLGMMAVGQFLYCLPPWRLKRWWWAGVLLSGVMNPLARLQCGAISGAEPVPALAYGVLVALHLGAAFRTRTLQRARDRRFQYRVAPAGAELAGMLAMAAGLIGLYVLCLHSVLPASLTPHVALGALFGGYAWSQRGLTIGRLRRGWILFALLAVAVIRSLLFP
jgi:hypothetical protein